LFPSVCGTQRNNRRQKTHGIPLIFLLNKKLTTKCGQGLIGECIAFSLFFCKEQGIYGSIEVIQLVDEALGYNALTLFGKNDPFPRNGMGHEIS